MQREGMLSIVDSMATVPGRRRIEMARQFVEEMQVQGDASVLYRASVAFSFSRHFVVRNAADRSEDFAPILEMATQAAFLATAATLGDRVQGLATALSQTPGLVRFARGRRTVIKPLSAASYMVWLLRPEVGVVYDEPLLTAVRSYGYIVGKGDYHTYLAAFRTERSKREAELQAGWVIAGLATDGIWLSKETVLKENLFRMRESLDKLLRELPDRPPTASQPCPLPAIASSRLSRLRVTHVYWPYKERLDVPDEHRIIADIFGWLQRVVR